MDRLACVDVPGLDLQVLRAAHPEWRGLPVAVVAEDRPQAPVLQAGPEARALGVRPGLRYAAALALARGLRAAPVAPADREAAVEGIRRRLARFSPGVEPSADEPGTFWLDARGLGGLFGTAGAWARALREDLAAGGFRAVVAVGFTRFGTWAAARSSHRDSLFRTPGEEAAAAGAVPLEFLGLPPDVRDGLESLGVRTVADLRRLPAGGVRERFGPAAESLHRRACGQAHEPLRPVPLPDPLARSEDLESPEDDPDRLLFRLKRLLDPLLATLADRHLALSLLEVRLGLDDLWVPAPDAGPGGAGGPAPQGNAAPDRGGAGGPAPQGSAAPDHGGAGGPAPQVPAGRPPVPGVAWTLRPAEPTLGAPLLLSLVRLRLEAADLPAGVVSMALRVEGAPATREQLRLFRESRRDLAGAARAFARLRARFGEDAVVRARLRDAHLPEAGFAWEPLQGLSPPAPRPAGPRPFVRRLRARATEMSLPPDTVPRPGLVLPGFGRVAAWSGPFVVSGGWWRRPVHREYGFATLDGGEVLWMYLDRPRGRWFLQGRLE